MALTPQQAFKVAFLQRCADDGLTIEETLARVKRANAAFEKQAAWYDALLAPLRIGADTLMWAGDKALQYGGPAALIAPPAIGALGGYAAAKLTGGSDESPADITTQEKIDAYRRAAEMARAVQQPRATEPRRRLHRSLV